VYTLAVGSTAQLSAAGHYEVKRGLLRGTTAG